MRSCRESSTGCWSCPAPTARLSRRSTASSRTSASPRARTLRCSTRRLPIDETLGVECLRRGGVTVLRATEGPEVQRCLTPGAGAIVLAPIDYDGETRGILGAAQPDPNAFDHASVETISLLATSAAVAMRNAEVVEGLARSEQHYRELHTQSADATLVSDADGRLLEANAAAEALFWYTVDELRAAPHARPLLRPGARGRARPGSATLHSRRELRAEQVLRRKDGSELQLEYSSRVLDDGRVHTTFRDVSQRRRNEERLRSSLDQLHAIVETQQEISALQLDPDAVTAAIVERTQRLDGRRRRRRAVVRRARVRLQPRLGHRVAACRAAARAADEPLRPGRRARRDAALPRRRARRPRRPRGLPRRRHPVADRRAALPRRPGRRDPRGHVGHAERLRRAQRRDDASDGAVRQHRLPELARARDAQRARRGARCAGAGRRAHADRALDLVARPTTTTSSSSTRTRRATRRWGVRTPS